FDELLIIQLGVLGQRRAWQELPAQPLPLDEAHLQTFLEKLPFQLTQAQQRVLADIRRDIAHPYPMTRLLQGDVGSGKTVIAATAMWAAVCNGAQAALMAPTEILAEQHFRKFQELFGQLLHPRRGWPLRVDLLTGSVTGQKRQELLDALAAGDSDILIGTHALIQETVQFHNLALIVVDEQHRFGVNQRAALREKGASLNENASNTPHTLVMSATPIPRTLALTIYGDMDVSAIDELPPGRKPIKTYWVKPDARPRIYQFIREQVAAGRQAFIIYPLVDESDRLEDVKAAIAEHKRLQTEVFPQLNLGLLHGRLSGKEKDAIMRAFAGGEYHILVSTAVVEVGIDIPNASVILIENADRFGLAQLHQFRGRVGRGSHASYCILVSQPKSDESSKRMRAMEQSQDGFELAEIDLRMRGPGEFFGTRQSGLPDLRLARLSDTRLLEIARREAEAILAQDPHLSHPDHALLAQQTTEFWTQEMDLS
ncbi:MAG: ATP-dependent DNA helicase RecG, partial [Chloroflexi bacterium]|nr:ATP-dependent DNA helicase RecG [Chloroflexota bacterium]